MKNNTKTCKNNKSEVDTVGGRIRLLRNKSGMTQEKLAEELNISAYRLNRIEKGRQTPYIEEIAAMSKLFESSCDYIIKGEPDDFFDKLADRIADRIAERLNL